MVIVDLCDYIFFRTYNFYLKKKDSIPVDRGIQLLSLVEIFFIADLVMIIDFFSDFLKNVDKRYLDKFVLGLPVAIIIIIINEIRYKRMAKKNKFKLFYERWEFENPNTKKMKGWIIVISPAIMLFGVPIMLWFFKKKLHL